MPARPSPSGPPALAAVDAFLASWGGELEAAVAGEARGRLSSELFDIPRRSCVGYACSYALLPDLIREIEARMPAEEVGWRMRRFGSRPYYLNAFVLMSSYLCGREQLLLDGRAAGVEDDPTPLEDLATVIGFYERMMCAYYGEPGRTGPAPGDHSQRVLGDEEWGAAEALLGPADGESRAAAAALGGALSLYSVILHGENRDGTFEHGPYPTGESTAAIVTEFTDLANAFLPWSAPETRLPLDNVVTVAEYEGISARFTMFGGAITEPPDPAAKMLRLATFTREGSEPRPLSREEMRSLAGRAEAHQLSLYEGALQWPRRRRTAHGIHLYANHLRPFAELAGAASASAGMESAWRAVGEPVAAELDAREDVLPLFAHLSKPNGRLFTPAGESGNRG